MTRILAVADEVDESLDGDQLAALRPDIVPSCGDLPFDCLEYLVSSLNVPLLYVPANHDPSLKPSDPTSGFAAFERVIRNFGPRLAVHGHVHPYGRSQPEGTVGRTRIVNAVPCRLIEV